MRNGSEKNQKVIPAIDPPSRDLITTNAPECTARDAVVAECVSGVSSDPNPLKRADATSSRQAIIANQACRCASDQNGSAGGRLSDFASIHFYYYD